MSTLRAGLALALVFALAAPAWSAEAKGKKDPQQKQKQNQKQDPKKQGSSLGGESTDKTVEGVVVRGIQHQVVELREYSGLELKVESQAEGMKLLVPFIEDAKTKRLSVDQEKLDQLSRLRVGATVRVTYYAEKDWNWIRALQVLDDGQDEDKDKDKANAKKKDNNNDHNRNNRNRNNRNRNNNNNNNRAKPKPQPQNNNQVKPVAPPKNNNMNSPQKIAPMPSKIH